MPDVSEPIAIRSYATILPFNLKTARPSNRPEDTCPPQHQKYGGQPAPRVFR